MTQRSLGRPVRVLVDGLSNRVGGGRRYLDSLLAALATHANREEIELHVVLPDTHDRVTVPDAAGVFGHVIRGVDSLSSRVLWTQTELPRLARRSGADVIFAPGNQAPLRAPCPVVMTLQVTPEAGVYHRDRVGKRFWWAAMSAMARVSAHRASRLIVVSEALRDWVVVNWSLPEGKLAVVPHGVGAEFRPRPPHGGRRGVQPPFLLNVGEFAPHKNLPGLLDAFAVVARRHERLNLLLAGERTSGGAAAVGERVRSLGLQDRVISTGVVSAGELAKLYRTASAVILPSFAESFGLPLVEAMACGTPVITSDIPVFREVAGGAALHYPVGDSPALARLICQLLEDPALGQRLETDGVARAAEYSWAGAARRTLDVFHALVGRASRLVPEVV